MGQVEGLLLLVLLLLREWGKSKRGKMEGRREGRRERREREAPGAGWGKRKG